MALLKIVNNPTDVGDADHVGGPDWDAMAAWINAIKGVASGQLLVSQGDSPPMAGGSMTGMAYTNAAQTWTATQTFSVSQLFNNGQWLQWKDSGGTTRNVIRMTGDDVYLVNEHATGDMYFRTNNVSFLTANELGFVTFIKPAQATGQFETVVRFTVADDTGSIIDIANLSSADTVFSPMIQTSVSANVPTTAPSVYYRHQIPTASDTGSTPVVQYTFRQTPAANIATRPLVAWYNNSTKVFEINPDGSQSVIQLMNNAIPIQWKDSGGTVRNCLNLTAGNQLQLGTTAGLTTAIFSGATSSALFWTATNFATFQVMPTAGTAESIAQWNLMDSANASYIRLGNFSATDAVFAPRIIFTNMDSTDQVECLFQCSPTMDSGAQAMCSLYARRTDNTAITTRPLFEFKARTFVPMSISANGLFNIITLAQTGVAETLMELKTSDTSSYLRFYNGTTTDSRFFPTIRGRQVEDATLYGLRIEGAIEPAHDTGTVPVVLFVAEQQGGTAIATRPLFDFRDSTTSVFKINADGSVGTSPVQGVAQVFNNAIPQQWKDSGGTVRNCLNLTAGNQLQLGTTAGMTTAIYSGATSAAVFWNNNNLATFQAMPIASAAETIATFKVTDSSGDVMIQNATTTDGEFVPWFRMRNIGTITTDGNVMDFVISAAQDTGTQPVVRFLARDSTSAAIATRPLFSFRNATTEVFQLAAVGSSVFTRTAGTGVAEVVATFTVSDNVSSYLRILNSTTTDAMFAPRLQSNVSATLVNQRSMYYQHYISSTQDTGTVSVVAFDARLSNDTPVAVRPLFEWYNCNVKSLALLPNGDLDNTGGRIINVEGSNTMSKIEGWQTNKRTGHLHGGCQISNEFGTGLLAPKGSGLYGATIVWAGGMYGNGGVFTGDQSVVAADGVFGYKCPLNIRRDRGIKLSVKGRIDRQSASRFFVGLKNNITQITSTTVPLLTTEGGIFIGWNETASTYKVWTCDAAGTVTETNTAVTIPAFSNDAEYLDLEVDTAGTTWTWTIWSLNHTTKLGTGTVTTTVPLVTHILSFHVHGEITDSTASQFLIWAGDIECIK